MKKIEDFSTAEGLVRMAQEIHSEKMKEAQKREEENQKRIADLEKKAKGLEEKIKTEKERLEKMITEFETLEAKEKDKLSAEFKKSRMTREDVKSGEITLAQFQSLGLTDSEIESAVVTGTIETLEKSSDLIREAAGEIARDELSLCETQVLIHNLLLNPVKGLIHSYKEAVDLLSYNLGPLVSSHHAAGSNKIQSEERIRYIDTGIGFTTGYTWPNLNLEQALRVRFDPVLPKEHVPSLLEQLSDIEPSDTLRLTITFHHKSSHWPGDPLQVRIESE